jgi:hypothetical protein
MHSHYKHHNVCSAYGKNRFPVNHTKHMLTFHGQGTELFSSEGGGTCNKPRHRVLECRFTK